MFQNSAVRGLFSTIRQHSADFLFSAVVIALEIAPIGSGEGVLPDKHRAVIAVGAGYMNGQKRSVWVVNFGDIVGLEQIDVDFPPIVDGCPRSLSSAMPHSLNR